MFSSKFGCPESTGNHSLTSKSGLKNPKIHELRYVLELKTCASCFIVSLIPGYLDEKYRNEIEMDKT